MQMKHNTTVVWRADLLPPLLHWDGAEERSGDSWHDFMGSTGMLIEPMRYE